MKSNISLIGCLLLSTFLLFVSCNENTCDCEKEAILKSLVINSSSKMTDMQITTKLPNGNTPEFIAANGPMDLIGQGSLYYWTFGGFLQEANELFKFDVSDIPPQSKIKSAILTLHGMDNNDFNPSEDVNIYKITQAWDVATVCWNNPPTYNSSEALFAPKTAMTSTYDITPYIQYWVDNPNANYGMIMQLAQRSLYHAFDFWASENVDPALRPELVIIYEEANYHTILE